MQVGEIRATVDVLRRAIRKQDSQRPGEREAAEAEALDAGMLLLECALVDLHRLADAAETLASPPPAESRTA